MMIKIKLFAILAELAGIREIELEIKDNSKLIDIIDKLFNNTNQKFRDYIIGENNTKLKDFITIIINEKIIAKNEILTKDIKDGDVIAFLTPVEGG